MDKNKPLANTRILLLRSLEQGKEWVKPLEQLGAKVILLPLISFHPIQKALEKITASYLKGFDLIIFTSVNGVRFAMLEGRDLLFRDKKIATIGPKTASTLLEFGLKSTFIAEQQDSEGLLKILPEDLRRKKVLLLTAEEARELLPEQLRNRGAQLSELKIYRTVPLTATHHSLKEGDWILFTSPSIVKQFFKQVYRNEKITAFCIGRVTEAELLKYYRGEIIVSKQATLDSICQTMKTRRTDEISHYPDAAFTSKSCDSNPCCRDASAGK